MALTHSEAYETAAKYLAQCAGFPAKNIKLYKTQQTYNQSTNMHEVGFVLRINHPVYVQMKKPLATINESWPLISEMTQRIELMKEPPEDSLFNADFDRFARLLADDLGYSLDDAIAVPTVSHYREKDRTDVYNIVIRVKQKKSVPEIAIEGDSHLPVSFSSMLVDG